VGGGVGFGEGVDEGGVGEGVPVGAVRLGVFDGFDGEDAAAGDEEAAGEGVWVGGCELGVEEVEGYGLVAVPAGGAAEGEGGDRGGAALAAPVGDVSGKVLGVVGLVDETEEEEGFGGLAVDESLGDFGVEGVEGDAVVDFEVDVGGDTRNVDEGEDLVPRVGCVVVSRVLDDGEDVPDPLGFRGLFEPGKLVVLPLPHEACYLPDDSPPRLEAENEPDHVSVCV